MTDDGRRITAAANAKRRSRHRHTTTVASRQGQVSALVAGYSKRSLVAKLGIKAGTTLAILNPPRGYERTLGRLPQTAIRRWRAAGPLDVIQFFATGKRELERSFSRLTRALAPAGALWISWPKQASRVPTDLTEDVIRAIGLAHGLVDVKVCAVDDVWSGLKLVRRLKDR